MRGYHRKFTPEARTLLKRLPPSVKAHIRALTDKIIENPFLGKSLQKELKGYYSIRHTHYRVIYSVNQERRWVVIEFVGLREDIYQAFSRLLKNRH